MIFLVNSNSIIGNLRKTNIDDLKNAIGIDIVSKLENTLVDSLSKTIDADILKKVQQIGLDNDSLIERKINAKRRIVLMQIFDEPPEFFKK